MAVQTDSGRRRHVLSALVQNRPGVLAHVSGMFASRGFNIDSLAVGETEDANLSRITFVVMGDDRHLEQVRKQLEKIVTVVKVHDISQRGLRRARPDADQDQRAAAASRRRSRPWSRFSAAGSWTSAPSSVDDRDLRPGEEDRGVHRAGAAVRHPRAGADGPDRPGARRRARSRASATTWRISRRRRSPWRKPKPSRARDPGAFRALTPGANAPIRVRWRHDSLPVGRPCGPGPLDRSFERGHADGCEDVLRPGCRPLAAQGEDDRGDRLRQPGPCPGPEPPRFGLQRGDRPAAGLAQLRGRRARRLQAGLRRARPPRPATW